MTAELPGSIGAHSTFAKTLIAATHDRWSRWRALAAPVQSPIRRVPIWNVLPGEQGFTLTNFMVAVAAVEVFSSFTAPALMTVIAQIELDVPALNVQRIEFFFTHLHRINAASIISAAIGIRKERTIR
jgi:hypothetical protein